MRPRRRAHRRHRARMSAIAHADAPAATLWNRTAGQLAQLYARGEATPEQALAAVLERLDAVNPRLNAVIALDLEGALAAAAASTRRWRAGTPLSPLDGIPVSVKDNILQAGLPATWGSRLYREFVPERDETPVARLRAGGAVLFGKTNVPEFTLQGYTDNLVFGPTRNPYDVALTPGGSSGGAVAAVAAGIGPLALGTDGGGSIRRPASHTGLVGFKPSRGLVPRAHGFPTILHDFEVAGPLARDVSDVVRMLRVIADDFAPTVLHRPLAILFAPTFAAAPVDPEIAASVAEAAGRFAALGHRVEVADPFLMAEPMLEIWPVVSQTALAWLMQGHPGFEHAISPSLLEMAAQGAARPATDYLGALNAIAAMGQDSAGLFETFDLILTPSAAALPWPATEPYPARIAGQAVGPRGHAVFTPFANVLGLPAVSLPARPSARGLPIGVQLVGAPRADALVLAAAAQYEAAGELDVPPS